MQSLFGYLWCIKLRIFQKDTCGSQGIGASRTYGSDAVIGLYHIAVARDHQGCRFIGNQ